jgi:transposase
MLIEEPFRYRLDGFDQQVFEAFVPPDHVLAVALREIDWEALRPVVEEFYSVDKGQPAIDPIRMLKLEYLKDHYQISDRQVIVRAKTDIAFRYFLQVGRGFRFPDSSSLCYFRARLGEEGFAKVFDGVVRQARQAGIVKDRLRLKDASHVIASIAVPTTLTLVAQIRDRLLKTIEPFDPEWAAGQRIEANLLRDRTKDQRDEFRLSARVTHLRELVAWSEQLPAPKDRESNKATAAAWKKFEDTLALAQKILADQEHPDAGRKTRSISDPEARRGKHGAYYDGYLADILLDPDSGIITQINVLEAGGDEARDAVAMVIAEQTAHGNQIDGLSIDGVGFNGEMLRALEGPVVEAPVTEGSVTDGPVLEGSATEGGSAEREPKSGLGVTVYVPPKTRPDEGRFTPQDFCLNEEGTAVTCPAGETSQYSQRNKGRHSIIYRFTRSTCDACPLQQQCVSDPGQGAFGRSVTKNDFEPEYQRARDRAKTATYTEVRREHPAVERKLNEQMNHRGGRRARYRGRGKVRIQELMAGLVSNVHCMLSWLETLRAEVSRMATACD